MLFPKEFPDKLKESKGKESQDKLKEFKGRRDLLRRKEQPPTELRAGIHLATPVEQEWVLEPLQDLLKEERGQQ